MKVGPESPDRGTGMAKEYLQNERLLFQGKLVGHVLLTHEQDGPLLHLFETKCFAFLGDNNKVKAKTNH